MELASHRTNDARQPPGVVRIFSGFSRPCAPGRAGPSTPAAHVGRLPALHSSSVTSFATRARVIRSGGASGVDGGRVWWPPRQHRVRDLRGESADGPELAAAGNEDQSPRHGPEISGTSNYVVPVSQVLRRTFLLADTREGPG